MTTQTYVVPNISCSHCTHTIETELKLLAGVQSVKAEMGSKKVTIAVAEPTLFAQVESTLAEIGYPVAK